MRPIAGEPPHVAVVLDGWLRVEGLTGAVKRGLRRRGLRVRGDVVHFAPEQRIPLLQFFAAIDVPFLLDHRQGWSPADQVAQLIEEGTHFDRPRAVTFDGATWLEHDHPWPAA